MQEYLTAKDIAEELAVSLTTAYAILQQCTRITVGRVVRVSRANFEAWKRRHEEAPVERPEHVGRRTRRAVPPRAEAPLIRSATYEALVKPYQPRKKKP